MKRILIVIVINYFSSHIFGQSFTVEPSSLNYGETLPGQSITLLITITNQADSTLHITNIKSSDSAFLASDTSFTISQASSEDVAVTFNPTKMGPFDGTLTIFQNNSTKQIELLGWTPIELNSTLTPNEVSLSILFSVQNTREMLLHLEASSNTKWAEVGSESSVLTVSVDNIQEEKKQDVVLFNGEELFVYKQLLGRMESGEHSLELVFEIESSSPMAKYGLH